LTVVEADQPAKTRSEKSPSGYGGKKQDKRAKPWQPARKAEPVDGDRRAPASVQRNPNTQARLIQDFVA
jgi:hypothetical protein